jgi:hypothetical protein
MPKRIESPDNQKGATTKESMIFCALKKEIVVHK